MTFADIDYVYVFRSLFSCCLVFLCAIIIVVGLCLDCNVSMLGGVYFEPILLLICFFILFVNEGYQVGLLGVKTTNDVDLIKYPRAKAIKVLIFGDGDKLPRLFLGQSFMVVVCTFWISQLTTFITFPSISNVPEWLMDAFVRSGFPGVVFTVNMVQLLPSVLAQQYPAQFLHYTPTVYYVIQIALYIESIGIVQSTYLLVYLFEKTVFSSQDNSLLNSYNRQRGSSLSDAEDPQSLQPNIESLTASQVVLWRVKAFCSATLTLACFGFLSYSIVLGYSVLSAPGPLLFLIFFLTLFIVFYCEGLKIAIVGSGHLSREEVLAKDYPVGIYDILANRADGIPKFLLGRQLIVVPMGFLIANITLFDKYYGMMSPSLFFLLVGLGIPGMLVTMQVAQLAPQVLASNHTGAFLRLPSASMVVYAALAIECLGLTQCAYLVQSVVQGCVCQRSAKYANATLSPLFASRYAELQLTDMSDGISPDNPIAVSDMAQQQ